METFTSLSYSCYCDKSNHPEGVEVGDYVLYTKENKAVKLTVIIRNEIYLFQLQAWTGAYYCLHVSLLNCSRGALYRGILYGKEHLSSEVWEWEDGGKRQIYDWNGNFEM